MKSIKYLKEKHVLKFQLSLHANFHLSIDESIKTQPPAVLRSDTYEVYQSSDVQELLRKAESDIITRIEKYQSRGSGWILEELLMLDLHIYEFSPLHASSYIPLPEKLVRKQAVINIQNKKDDKCLLWNLKSLIQNENVLI